MSLYKVSMVVETKHYIIVAADSEYSAVEKGIKGWNIESTGTEHGDAFLLVEKVEEDKNEV